MRVVYLIDRVDPCGSQWVAIQHVQALRRVGIESEVLAAVPATEEDGVVRQVPSFSSAALGSADVVVCTGPQGIVAARELAPSVWGHLCVAQRPNPQPGLHPRRAGEEPEPSCSFVLVPSPTLVEVVQRHAGGSCTWVPTVADPCSPLDLEPGPLRVLLSPSPRSDTDDDRAREILAPLLAETPTIEILGGGSCSENDDSPFPPSMAGLIDLLARVQIVVGTWTEVVGFDFVAFQALACGRPAVLTDVPSYRDLDPRRRASLTVPPDDAEALRAAVRRLRDEASLRTRLAAEARRLAAVPSLEQCGELLDEIFTAARERRALLDDWRERPWPEPPHEDATTDTAGRDAARRYQWEVERELSRRLIRTTRPQRRELYSLAYDEFFRLVPFQPQLTQGRDPAAQRTIVDLQLRLVEPFVDPDTVFLEIGAGDCAFARTMASQVQRVHAVEASRGGGEESTGREPPNFHFTVADLPPLPVADESVDVAYSSHVVEHLHPDDLAPHFLDVRRVLTPGGLYLCITPNRLLGPHDISRHFTDRASGLHLQEYTHRELALALRRCGFSPVQALRRLGARPPRGWLAVVSLLEGILELIPPARRRRLLTGLTMRPEPFRPLEQVKLVAYRPLDTH